MQVTFLNSHETYTEGMTLRTILTSQHLLYTLGQVYGVIWAGGLISCWMLPLDSEVLGRRVIGASWERSVMQLMS